MLTSEAVALVARGRPEDATRFVAGDWSRDVAYLNGSVSERFHELMRAAIEAQNRDFLRALVPPAKYWRRYGCDAVRQAVELGVALDIVAWVLFQTHQAQAQALHVCLDLNVLLLRGSLELVDLFVERLGDAVRLPLYHLAVVRGDARVADHLLGRSGHAAAISAQSRL